MEKLTSRKDVRLLILLVIILVAGCSTRTKEPIRFRYGQELKYTDDFYGIGICTVTGYSRWGKQLSGEDIVAIQTNCKFKSGYSGNMTFDQKDLKLE